MSALKASLTALSLGVSIMLSPAHAIAAVPPSAPQFSCDYWFNAWQTGFTAELAVVNHGPRVDGWTVHWTFSAPTRALTSWSAELSQTGMFDIVATPASWNKVIESGSMISFGWTALAPATEVPSDITVNGVPC